MTQIGINIGPQEFGRLRDLIVEMRGRKPRRLAQVAAYMIQRPDDVAFGTVSHISGQAGVQPSTLIRFAKTLGYSGFSGLQAVFQQRLRDRPNNYEARRSAFGMREAAGSVALASIEGFSQAAIRSIEMLRNRIKPECFSESVRILASAETIYLIGLRRSYPIVSYMSYALGTLGVRTEVVGSPNGIDREALSFAGPRDAALAVSFAPYTPATIEYVRQVAGQNTPLVVITDNPFSPLALKTSIWFEIAEADFEGFRTLTAAMTLAAAVVVAVAEQRHIDKRDAAQME
jgi:DNA-binding MurR/RpiR family transcriptional regulator